MECALGAFDIKYMPRSSIKGQVLADLVAEFAEPSIETITEEKDMGGKSVGVISAGGDLALEGLRGWRGQPERIWSWDSLIIVGRCCH